MGIRTALWSKRYADAITASVGAALDPSTLPPSSPWSTSSSLERVVYKDIFGTDFPVNTRAAAMRIPTLARARNLIVSSICKNPLVTFRGAERLAPTPTWLISAPGSTPQHRLAWTVDDHIWYGWSLWWRENGADGFPAAAGRVNQADWTVNDDNRVEINGVEQDDDRVILIPGLHEGVLTYGVDAIADGVNLLSAVGDRIKNPIPAIDLHQTGGRELNRAERLEFIEDWAAARQGANSSVGFSSKDIEVRELGTGPDSAQFMVEARNASSVDLARMVGVSAGLVDATAPKASLNYETKTGRNEEFVDRDLDQYITPITARLSLDDCVPHGTRVDLDLADFTGPTSSPTGAPLED